MYACGHVALLVGGTETNMEMAMGVLQGVAFCCLLEDGRVCCERAD